MLEHGTHAGTRAVARRKVGLFIHATAFATVNVLLITINLSNAPGGLWFQWPLLGWGIGLLAHAAAAFSLAGRQGIRRERRRERREARRERREVRRERREAARAGAQH